MRQDFLNEEHTLTEDKEQNGCPYSDNNFDLLNLPAQITNQSVLTRPIRTAKNDNKFLGSNPIFHCNPCGDHSTPTRKNQKHDQSNQCDRNSKGPTNGVVCLYSNKKCPKKINSSSACEKPDDFLIPRFRKQRNAFSITNNIPIREINEDGVFPFKTTSSGCLKVNANQVAFESNKFSVLIADPKRTQVKVSDKRNSSVMQKEDIAKNSAFSAIMKGPQGLGPSLGSLLAGRFADAPIRKEKEASEYEGKATNVILDPELNLTRLGYSANEPIDWNEVILPEKKNLYLELYARITNFTNADCKVYIDNEEFNCHLLVLQCYSEVFHTYVAVKKVELPSDKCSPASFAFIYEWMITGDPSYRELNRENVLDIFNAAKYLKIKDLVEQCWAFIDNMEVFTEDTAFLLYIDAKDKGLPEVRDLMLPRIQKFFLMLVSSQDWLELQLEDVQCFLFSNYICVNCEMEVFMSAVRWLKHDWENRDKYKTQVLGCVRFGNIAPWQLVDIKRNPDNPDFRDLAKDPEICKMIDDGLAFVIIKYWYGQENEDFLHWNSILALKEPPSRNWSGTEKTYFTYREFLIYLDQYRRNQMMERSKPREKRATKDGKLLSPNISQEKLLATTTVAAASINNNIGNKPRMPTLDEFLSARKGAGISSSNTKCIKTTYKKSIILQNSNLRRPKIPIKSKKEAVAIIERAYRKYKLRSNVRGLSQRVSRKLRKRDNNLIKRFFDYPKYSKTSFESPLRTNATDKIKNYSSRLAVNNEEFIKMQPLKHQIPIYKSNEEYYTGSKRSFSKYLLENKALLGNTKEYLSDTSLYFLEHESVLVFGGINVHNKYGIGRNTGKDIYRYLPIDNDWEFVGEMPSPRTHHCVAYLLGRIYIVGGSDPRDDDVKGKFVVVDSVWSFDPVKRIWFTEGNLNLKRKNFGLVVLGQHLYAIGGQDRNSRVTDTMERYNPSKGNWEFMSAMKHPRMGLACAKFEERIWVGGGMCGSSQKPLTDSVEVYDAAHNQWTEVTRLRMPRCFANFFTMSNNLYLIAGAGRNKSLVNNTVSFASIDVWNKEEQNWEEHAEMEVARHGHTTGYLGTQILIIGGVTTIYMRSLSSIECYCTTRGTWIRGMCTLPNCLSGHATVTLPPAILL